MVVNPDGLVLTNNHVIDGATSVSVTLPGSGTSYQARVVGYDSVDDVAPRSSRWATPRGAGP